MPQRESSVLSPGNYQVVAWDLDTTGRRLIDEICQIAGHFSSSTASPQSERAFSQYVMPHRNPNPGARRSFGIKVSLLSLTCPAWDFIGLSRAAIRLESHLVRSVY